MNNQHVERAVIGGLKQAINDHGPITSDQIGSAAKRIVGQLKNVDGYKEDSNEHPRTTI